MKFGVDFDVTRNDAPKLLRLEILAYPNIPLTLTHVNVQESTDLSQASRLYRYTWYFVMATRLLRAITLIENISDTQAKKDLFFVCTL